MASSHYSCLYEITSRSIDFILNTSSASKDLDGIMYPSVWGEGEGMNICLKTDVVDNSVHFQSASVQCIDKEVGQGSIFGVAESLLMPDGLLK